MEWVIALVLGAFGLTLVLAGANGSAGALLGTITGTGTPAAHTVAGGVSPVPNSGPGHSVGGYPQNSAFTGLPGVTP